jgi:hypothetical protein
VATFVEPPQNFTIEEAKKWRPRMKSGYFYVQDREYYLYAKKVTQSLKDITFTKFELEFDPTSIKSLTVSGVEYSNWYIDGNSVVVNHRDLDAFFTLWLTLVWDDDFWDYVLGAQFEPDTEVEIEYCHNEWNPGTESFDEVSNTELFKVKDGYTDYKFQVIPSPGSPVVITDDKITDENPIDYSPKFSVDYATGFLSFHGQNNLVQNSDFCKWEEEMGVYHPRDWIESSGTSLRATDAFYGPYSIIPQSGSYVFQQPQIASNAHVYLGARLLLYPPGS